jgi:hypothetical protein
MMPLFLFLLFVVAILVKQGVDCIKAQECRNEVNYMNQYEDGSKEYKKHADKFFKDLKCNPKLYK